jgi:hypothetical protein
MLLIPGPLLASTTWFQCRVDPAGNLMNLFTSKTQALQISPLLSSSRLKHFSKYASYLLESVNLELLDLALQMQQPFADRKTFGL